MFINTGDKMAGQTGDVVLIIHDVATDRYHPYFFEEKSPPGPMQPIEKLEVLRLKSRMHHTTGFDTFKKAKESLINDAMMKVQLPEDNIYVDSPVPWDLSKGEAIEWLCENWVKQGKPFTKECIL